MKFTAEYPERVNDFRTRIIRRLPKIPNNRSTSELLKGQTTNNLILSYLTWRMRFVPARPRVIRLWSGWSEGLDPPTFFSLRATLEEFRAKVERGVDLTPFLSTRVNRGAVSVESSHVRDEIDAVLTKFGLHHFHIASPSAGTNPKGRGRRLIFADVSDDVFNIFAVSDHDAFEVGSPEWRRLFNVSNLYLQSRLPRAAAYIQNPVMSSGHSLTLTLFSNHCETRMLELDSKLDDPDFVNLLYNDQPILRNGEPVPRPKRSNFRWDFNDMSFGVLESRAQVFFAFVPYNR
jgi:hypothetical protein